MRMPKESRAGRFCWVDLAATDENVARDFYGGLFHWTTTARHLGNGTFQSFSADGDEVASLYRLSRRHLTEGVPSHWTPYVCVANARRSAARAEALGGTVIVSPFEVPGVAWIALVQDPIGALFGLWERAGCRPDEK